MTIKIIQARKITAVEGQEGELNMEVLFGHLPMFVPFTARRNDVEPHGRELYNRAMFGDFGPIEIVPLPLPTKASQQELVNTKLIAVSNAIAPLEDAEKLGVITETEAAKLVKWRRYRVELYRLTQSDEWPLVKEWPESPENEQEVE